MAKDLTVRLGEDRPGEASRVAEALGSAGVNMESFVEVGGIAHVLVEDDDLESARRALQQAGLAIAYEHEVEVVQIENRPGALAELTQRIAEAGVNLRFVYVAAGTRIVFGAHDPEALRRALRR